MSNHSISVLNGYDANKYVCDSLWKPEQNHVKFRMLDTILIENGSICSWLFESSDGLIKSKTRARWTANGVLERCFDSSNVPNSKLVLFTHDCVIWNLLTKDILTNTISSSGPSRALIVSFSHLEPYVGSNPAFIEQIYDSQARKSGKNNLTSILVDTSTMQASRGNKLSSAESITNQISQDKILSLSKDLGIICRNYVEGLVKIIENKKNVKITSMTTVLVVENECKYPQPGMPAPVRRVWLHHIRSITMVCEVKPDEFLTTESKSKLPVERRSVSSSTVSLTNSTAFSRPAKCMGDFCQYNEAEESRIMDVLAESTGFNTNTRLEAIRARQRHRRLTKAEEERTAEFTKHDILESNEDKEDDGSVDYDIDDDRVGPLPPKSTAAFVIPFKSIALARQEMAQIEMANKEYCGTGHDEIASIMERVPWGDKLIHWWVRSGRALGMKHSLVPVTAADKINAALLKPKTVSDAAPIADSSSDHSPQNGDNVSAGSTAIPFDLSDTPFAQRECKKAGLLSWYYSDATICEKCLSCYKELDSRRKSSVSAQIKTRREEDSKKEVELGRNIEKRIFQQRKAASRLAKPIGNASGMHQQSAITNKSSKSSRQDWDLFEDSVNNDRSLLLAGTMQANGVSKGILPPMPWQLGDKDNRDSYANSGSAFIKNIGKRSQEMAADVRQERMLAKYSGLGQAGSAEVRALAAAEDIANKRMQEMEAEWQRATGQLKQPTIEPLNPRIKQQQAINQDYKQASFDPERLLHPYQRNIQKLREDLLTEDEREARTLSSSKLTAPVKILLEKKVSVQSVVLPKSTKALVKKAMDNSLDRSASVPLHLKLMQERDAQYQQLQHQVNKAPSYHTSLDDQSLRFEGSTSSTSNASFYKPSQFNSSFVEGQGSITLGSPVKPKSALRMSRDASVSPTPSSNPSSTSPGKTLRKQVSFGIFDTGDHFGAPSSITSAKSPKSPSRSLLNIGNDISIGKPPMMKSHSVSSSQHAHENDDDDDDDEEIGWSPFVIPL